MSVQLPRQRRDREGTHVDCDLDRDFTALDNLAVHLLNRLLLHILRSERDEAKATTLTRLAALLQLTNHVARDGAKRNLGRLRLIVLEKFLKLYECQQCSDPNIQ